RTVGKIEPEWVEPVASHLVRHTYSDPHWCTRHGAAMVTERVMLYGLTLIADRPVARGRRGGRRLGRSDDVTAAEMAREMFIRHALVEGEWRGRHAFLTHNAEVLEEARKVEHRARRRGLVWDEDALFQFYDEQIGSEVTSQGHFDSWW